MAAAVSALFTATLAAGRWEEARTLCAKLVAFYELVYHPRHPMIGLQKYTLGDITYAIACEEKNTHLARLGLDYFRNALDVLQYTHGGSACSGLVAGLRGRIDDIALSLARQAAVKRAYSRGGAGQRDGGCADGKDLRGALASVLPEQKGGASKKKGKA